MSKDGGKMSLVEIDSCIDMNDWGGPPSEIIDTKEHIPGFIADDDNPQTVEQIKKMRALQSHLVANGMTDFMGGSSKKIAGIICTKIGVNDAVYDGYIETQKAILESQGKIKDTKFAKAQNDMQSAIAASQVYQEKVIAKADKEAAEAKESVEMSEEEKIMEEAEAKDRFDRL
jgi:hypothetical protein